MVSKQQVQILIEAQENVSRVAKKAEDALSRLGKVGSKGINAINKASNMISSSFSKLHSFVDRAREKFNSFASSSDKFGMIRNSISNAANSFGQLISSSNLASRAMEKIKSVSDGIKTKFTSLSTRIKSFGSSAKSSLTSAFSLSGIKEKLSSVGGSIDKLKSKFRSLANEAKKTGGGFGFLKNAASMTVGMLGYDLVNGFVQAGRAAINAEGQLQYFGKRMNMSSTESKDFSSKLDTLQQSFRKVDMHAVGASAEEMAVKLKLPKSALEDLTKTTAVMSSAFVKEGRTQEDAILAVSDAMDGQFRRLQEIGISQEMLKNNGWDGDLQNKDSLLKAMNKTLDDMGFTQTAQDITTLDDAYQALTVSGGILLRKILVPITPALISIMDAVSSVMTKIGDFANALQNGFSKLPEWAQIGIGIAAVAIAVGVAVAAFGGLEAVIVAIAGPIMSFIGIIGAISLPVVAVVAAIALLVAAIYEIGKAFGWWKDVNTMLAAIGAGVQRLWSAFINHPDVQGAIKAIVDAWNWLVPAVGNAISAVMNFFGINTGGKFDIVSSLIHGIGDAWNAIKPIVMAVATSIGNKVQLIIQIIQGIVSVVSWVISSFQRLQSSVGETWAGIMEILSPYINTITTLVEGLINTFELFKTGQIDLPTAVMTALSLLWTAYSGTISRIGSAALTFGGRLLSYGLRAAYNFLTGMVTYFAPLPVKILSYLSKTRQHILTQLQQWVTIARQRAMQLLTGIISYLSQLPGRVAAYLLQVLTNISTQGYQWIVSARNRARDVVTGVIDYLSQLPGRVVSAIAGVLTAILEAGGQWVSNAISKAQEVVDGAADALSSLPGRAASALSGVVDAIVSPFRDAYNAAKGVWDSIASLASSVPTVRTQAGGEGMTEYLDSGSGAAASGTINPINNTNNVKVKGDLNLNVDVNGIPNNANTDAVEKIFNKMVNNKSFKDELIREIASSSLFQSLDAKEKQRLLGKSNRSLGV